MHEQIQHEWTKEGPQIILIRIAKTTKWMSSFEEYISNLKLEAERGSAPNHKVPLDKFIKVADSIALRVTDIHPEHSMTIVKYF